jgi:glycerophosphoryl diester phosphodiesterase
MRLHRSENRFFQALIQAKDRPLIIAHRGDSSHAPENTIEAARLGKKSGADAWELDVRVTRDGIAIVLHDESLLRTTDLATKFEGDPRVKCGGSVADFDLSEIQTLDAGSWFLREAREYGTSTFFGTKEKLESEVRDRISAGAVTVPTLREALETTRHLDWLVNIELKTFPDRDFQLIDAVFAEVSATGTADRVLISSSDHKDVALASMRSNGVVTGVLTTMPLRRPERYVRELVGADCFHGSPEVIGANTQAYRKRPGPDSLRADLVATLNRHEIPVLVYTVNDREPGGLASNLAEMGVSGLFSDDPGGLLTLFGGRSPD